MSNELHYDFDSGRTLFACRFQLNGDVFLANGASDEVWGVGGRDADDYDIAMAESGSSGHYVGDFDPDGNIGANRYKVAVYEQIGGSPADSDIPALGKGEILWDGSSEIFQADEDDVTDAHETTDALIISTFTNVFNIYDES